MAKEDKRTGTAGSRLVVLLDRMNRKELAEVTPAVIWIFLKELIRILIYKMEGRS